MGVSVGQTLTKRVGWLTAFILKIPILGFLAELLNKGRIDDARRDVEQGLEEVLGKVAIDLVASSDEFYRGQAEVIRGNIRQYHRVVARQAIQRRGHIRRSANCGGDTRGLQR